MIILVEVSVPDHECNLVPACRISYNFDVAGKIFSSIARSMKQGCFVEGDASIIVDGRRVGAIMFLKEVKGDSA